MAELVSLAATVDADFTPTILLKDNKIVSLALNTATYRCSKEFLTLNDGRPEGRLEFTYTDKLGREIKKTYSFSNIIY